MKPMPMNMTPAEQERWAYAEGNTALATLLAQLADADEAAADAEDRAWAVERHAVRYRED